MYLKVKTFDIDNTMVDKFECNKLLSKYILKAIGYDILACSINKEPTDIIRLSLQDYIIYIDFYLIESFTSKKAIETKNIALSKIKRVFVDEFNIPLDRINSLKGQKYLNHINMEIKITDDEYYNIYSLLKIKA